MYHLSGLVRLAAVAVGIATVVLTAPLPAGSQSRPGEPGPVAPQPLPPLPQPMPPLPPPVPPLPRPVCAASKHFKPRLGRAIAKTAPHLTAADSSCLEKRIAEHAVRAGGSVQVGYARIEVGFAHQPRCER